MKGHKHLDKAILANLWIQSGSSALVRGLPLAGWDSITLDLQHGQMGLDGCIALLDLLYGCGSLMLVRISALDQAEIGKVLDAGADGVICPSIENAVAARQLLEYCNYPPTGRRSFGPTRHRLRTGHGDADYKQCRPIVFAMIETAVGVDQVASIAATVGLSGLYVGPSDLSVDLGMEPGFDRKEPEIQEAIRAVIGAARAANMLAGVHCASSAYAASMAALGARFLTLTSDYALLATASRSVLNEFQRATITLL